MTRDKNKDANYFKKIVDKTPKRVEKFENWIRVGKTPKERIPIVQKMIGGIKLRAIVARYSLGGALEDMQEEYLSLLKGYDLYWPEGHVLAKSRGQELQQYLDYDDMLWMLSMACIFDVPRASFFLLAKLIDRDEVVDNLYEFLLSYKLERKTKIEESYVEGWALYKSIRKIILMELSEEDRIDLFCSYLPKEWKRDHKLLLSDLKGRHDTYYGAWSFESAAVVVILGIDDSSFRNKEYYPKDLVDFYRS